MQVQVRKYQIRTGKGTRLGEKALLRFDAAVKTENLKHQDFACTFYQECTEATGLSVHSLTIDYHLSTALKFRCQAQKNNRKQPFSVLSPHQAW
mmetsp:Transcript_12143/g.28095  ORF Transcript_12143/g.28095 Transcript_12143/m.28095 type:complete len:94 (-) Transcript_12143:123-404(-)